MSLTCCTRRAVPGASSRCERGGSVRLAKDYGAWSYHCDDACDFGTRYQSETGFNPNSCAKRTSGCQAGWYRCATIHFPAFSKTNERPRSGGLLPAAVFWAPLPDGPRPSHRRRRRNGGAVGQRRRKGLNNSVEEVALTPTTELESMRRACRSRLPRSEIPSAARQP